MKTQQEQYYERKNKQAKELDDTFASLVPFIFLFLIGWVLIAVWPLTLFCGVCYLIYKISVNIQDAIKGVFTDLYNLAFSRNDVEPRELIVMDALATLALLFFVIVILFSIVLK